MGVPKACAFQGNTGDESQRFCFTTNSSCIVLIEMESGPPVFSVGSPKTSPLAVWSLVLGCVGIVLLLGCIGPLLAIPAVICGHMAQGRIKRSAGALTGQGLALGGLITGYVTIGLSFLIIPMMLAIAVPNFVRARQIAQTNMCINNLRMIDGA